MHVDHVAADGCKMNIPHVFDDYGARDRAMRVAHQKFEQREFLGFEIDLVSFTRGLMRGPVDFQIRNPQLGGFLHAARIGALTLREY